MNVDLTVSTDKLVTVMGEYPVVYLGRSNDNLWHVISYYQESLDNNQDTGWTQLEVTDTGILRSDVEGGTPSPTPFIKYELVPKEFFLGIYPDNSTVATYYNPDSLPLGDVGRLKLSYDLDGNLIVNATVVEILPKRD